MLRLSILGALVSVTLVAAAGCDQSETSDIESVRSAVTGAGGGSVEPPFVDSPIRGYTFGSGSGTHAVVYRSAPSATIGRRTGTPLGFETSVGGALAFNSAPWGYKRADGVEAVLYIEGPGQRVREITSAGNLDFCSSPVSAPRAAPAPGNGPVPDAIGYVRADGRSAVVYRSEIDHVIEILSSSGGGPPWTVSDLTSMSGAQVTVNKGSVFPFASSDGFNIAAYVASDSHLHMLSMNPSWPWHDDDLSLITGDTTAPATDPWGYVRSDSYNCIVWVGSDGQMHETYHWPFSGWGSGALPAASPLANLYQRPSAYARGDGINTVVYVGTDAHLHELALLSSGWTDGVFDTGNIAMSYQVFGHRPPGARGSILFRGTNMSVLHGYELLLPNTTSWQLQEF